MTAASAGGRQADRRLRGPMPASGGKGPRPFEQRD